MKNKLLLLAGALVLLGILVLVAAFSAGLGLGRFVRRAVGMPPHESSTDGGSYFADARPLADAFKPVLDGKAEICTLIIREHEAALTIRTGPEETQEQLLRQADRHVSANGHGFCTAGSVRSLNDAVFPWSDVDLGVVAAMATEAPGKLGLDSSTRLSHLLLEREVRPPEGPPPADGGPVLRSAPPRWKAIFSSSAAYAEFDLAGRFVGGMQAGGAPVGPGGQVTYHDDAPAVAKVIGEKLGQDFKLAELAIFPASFTVEGRRASETSGAGRYTYRMSELSGPDKATAELLPDLEHRFFQLSDLDFSLVPRMLRDARAELGTPDAAASQIRAEKTFLHPELRWTVYLAGAESQPLDFDMKGKRVGSGATAGSDNEGIQATDLPHADPLDLLGQATAAAQKVEPKAQLIAISTMGPLVGGTVDLTGGASVLYRFEYSYLDQHKPPGQDKVEGAVWVTASGGRLKATLVPGGATSLKFHPERVGGKLPQCPLKRAWAAAVQSGVPDNAVAQLLFDVTVRNGASQVWRIGIDGHPELDREVDSMTCKVVRRGRR